MACYLLLRNNQESGPFSIEELIAQNLKPTDLIWIEGQSTIWKHPTELDALQTFVAATEISDLQLRQSAQANHASTSVFVVFPPQQPPAEEKEHIKADSVFTQRFENPHRRYNVFQARSLFRFRKTFSKPHGVLWLGCVAAGLLFSALLVKSILDTYDESSIGLTGAAAVPITKQDAEKATPEEDMYQNALTTEIVPVDTATLKPLKKAAPKIDLKKLVQLEANDYQVGLLGGIKNLRLLVINKSTLLLDKVSFELQYLKSNGNVIKTVNLALKAVSPKSSKSIAVPANGRGTKIAYYITGIHSRQGSDALLHL